MIATLAPQAITKNWFYIFNTGRIINLQRWSNQCSWMAESIFQGKNMASFYTWYWRKWQRHLQLQSLEMKITNRYLNRAGNKTIRSSGTSTHSFLSLWCAFLLISFACYCPLSKRFNLFYSQKCLGFRYPLQLFCGQNWYFDLWRWTSAN